MVIIVGIGRPSSVKGNSRSDQGREKED